QDAGAEGDPRCRGRDRLQIDGRPGEVDRPTREERHQDSARRRTVAAQGRPVRSGHHHQQDRDGDSGRRTAAAVVVVCLSTHAALVMNSTPFVPAKAGTQFRTAMTAGFPPSARLRASIARRRRAGTPLTTRYAREGAGGGCLHDKVLQLMRTTTACLPSSPSKKSPTPSRPCPSPP